MEPGGCEPTSPASPEAPASYPRQACVMTFDDSDDPLVAREDAEPLDTEILDAERLPVKPDDSVGLDDSEEPPAATEVAGAAQGNGHGQGRAHDSDLVTLYLNDIGRVALLTHERERELI